MSTSRPRAPINQHADPLELDEGTLVRTESSPPGTIGINVTLAKDSGPMDRLRENSRAVDSDR